MSVYKKFIDSARKSASKSHSSSNQQQQQQLNSPLKSRIKLDFDTKRVFSEEEEEYSSNKMIAESGYIRAARFESRQLNQQQQQQQVTQYVNQRNNNNNNNNYNYNQTNENVNNHQSIINDQYNEQQTNNIDSIILNTDDPVLIDWLKSIRFETDLEGLSSLQAKTLTIDQYSARALSVRNSQVSIQNIRAESKLLLEKIDELINFLPINLSSFRLKTRNNSIPIGKFQIEFTYLWRALMEQTSNIVQTASNEQQVTNSMNNNNNNYNINSNNNYINYNQNKFHNLTITNCSPKKAVTGSKVISRHLEEIRADLRVVCIELANHLNDAIQFEEEEEGQQQQQQQQQNNINLNNNNSIIIDNNFIESRLRVLKQYFGKFIETSIRAECANIVKALEYDFSQSSLNRISSTASLRATRPFESSSAQLPLKWALIALWQLTKDDQYLCRTLAESWQTITAPTSASSKVAKRLDYSTKYDSIDNSHSHSYSNSNSGSSEHSASYNYGYDPNVTVIPARSGTNSQSSTASLLRSDYQKFYDICQRKHNTVLPPLAHSSDESMSDNDENRHHQGALSSALKSKQQRNGCQTVRQLSTIELLIDIIISQPNKHERLDVMNFVHLQAQSDRLIDVDEWDQSLSAAIYTSNQYKVAALRILNHLCVNDQAIKTILKCFSTPPPGPGQPIPENKILRSIFECYQTSQEHIYQNETTLKSHVRPISSLQRGSNHNRPQRGLKRTRQTRQMEDMRDDYSDYGVIDGQSNCNPFLDEHNCDDYEEQDSGSSDSSSGGDDLVVKEAITLLIQLTNSFHRSQQGHDYYTLIGRFSIDLLVRHMTQIIKSTSSREMLFLSLTALANISFITTEPMKHHGTNGAILEIFRTSRKHSKDLELRDQAVTILANTADKNILDIVNNGGTTFLLSCLETCPTRMANYKHINEKLNSPDDDSVSASSIYENDYLRLRIDDKPRDRRPINFGDSFPEGLDTCPCDQTDEQRNHNQENYELVSINGNYMVRSSPQNSLKFNRYPIRTSESCLSRLSSNELAAIERIHQKTAIAFARMSADSSTIKMIHKYGGVKQMIDLCKFSYKRNHSVTVLMACSAALKKMAKVLDREVFRHYNALDLIELDLTKVLDIYGNTTRQGQRQQNSPPLLASEV